MKRFLIAISLVILIVFWSGCSQPPAGPAGQGGQAGQDMQVKASGKVDCTMLTGDDAKATLGLAKVDETMALQTASMCTKQLTGFTGSVPTTTMSFSVIESGADPAYQGAAPPVILGQLCKDKPSLGLGDYASCNFSTQISFGRGNYIILLTCPQCSEENAVKLAKLVLGRV
ncbi:MAG: hypothetical protein V1493_01955 [Candidatus Diapherotrites archaeon]